MIKKKQYISVRFGIFLKILKKFLALQNTFIALNERNRCIFISSLTLIFDLFLRDSGIIANLSSREDYYANNFEYFLIHFFFFLLNFCN